MTTQQERVKYNFIAPINDHAARARKIQFHSSYKFDSSYTLLGKGTFLFSAPAQLLTSIKAGKDRICQYKYYAKQYIP